MKKLISITVLAFVMAIVYTRLTNRKYLTLTRTDFHDIDEIDTIESHTGKGIYFLGLVRHRALGKFSYDLAVTKQNISTPNEFLGYEIENYKKAFRISKDYVAFIKTFGGLNHGWFSKEGGSLRPDFRFKEDSSIHVITSNLAYRLYKLNSGTLQIVSNNVDDLMKQQDGLYFVPSPGFGVLRLYDKMEIFSLLDSISCLRPVPDVIKISPLRE